MKLIASLLTTLIGIASNQAPPPPHAIIIKYVKSIARRGAFFQFYIEQVNTHLVCHCIINLGPCC